jgi:hypothetical protein
MPTFVGTTTGDPPSSPERAYTPGVGQLPSAATLG